MRISTLSPLIHAGSHCETLDLLNHELVDREFKQTISGSMDKVPLYLCSECGKGFEENRKLNINIEAQYPSLCYVCDICSQI